jgi:hypothetical protein
MTSTRSKDKAGIGKGVVLLIVGQIMKLSMRVSPTCKVIKVG